MEEEYGSRSERYSLVLADMRQSADVAAGGEHGNEVNFKTVLFYRFSETREAEPSAAEEASSEVNSCREESDAHLGKTDSRRFAAKSSSADAWERTLPRRPFWK